MSVVVIQHRIRWTKKGLFPILPFLLLSLFFVYSLFFFYRLSLLYFSFLILASSIFCFFFFFFYSSSPFFYYIYLSYYSSSFSFFIFPSSSSLLRVSITPFYPPHLSPYPLIALHPSSLSSLSLYILLPSPPYPSSTPPPPLPPYENHPRLFVLMGLIDATEKKKSLRSTILPVVQGNMTLSDLLPPLGKPLSWPSRFRG